jgi:putative transcriptional regulator
MTRRQPSPPARHEADDADASGRIVTHLAALLEERGMTMTELAERVGITLANMSILKNGHARAIRFTTLAAICRVLNCQPGDILRWEP